MIRRRVRGKILLIFLVLLITVILSLTISMGQLFTNIYTSQNLRDLQNEVTTCSKVLEKQSMDQLQRGLTKYTCHNTVVLDEQQGIRFRTGNISWLKSGESLPGVARVLRGEHVVLKTQVGANPDPMFVIGTPLSKPFHGAVFRLESAVSGDQVIRQMNKMLVLGIVGAILLATGVAQVLAVRMASPLERMVEMAERIIRGDFRDKVHIKGTDELARLGEALNSLTEHLHRVEASRAEFLSNVSHEIRTPLSYVQGYAQILQEGMAETKEEQANYLSIIQEEVGRVRVLLEDLLDLAAFEEGSWKLEKEQVDLSALTQLVMETLCPHALKKRIGMTFEETTPPLHVFADRNRLQQAMINVIHNAIQYTQEGGDIRVVAVPSGDHVLWSVRDNGAGIPAEELPRLWERFYRLEKSRSRDLGGSGIGLSIVKRIIEAHGGQVYLQSQSGEGTTVSWELPRAGFDNEP